VINHQFDDLLLSSYNNKIRRMIRMIR
jgi:hypothetical protein